MKAEFHIQGMHCESCAVEIRDALERTAGVLDVDIKSNAKTAVIEFDDDTVKSTTLLKKIQDLGYNATVAQEPQSSMHL